MHDLNHFDILILPSWHNSGPDHWQTHWEAAFPNMRRVEQDDWEAPIHADWSCRITAAVERCQRPVLLVAHSLGTALVTRWAHEAENTAVVGAFLVATSDIDRFAGVPDSPLRGFDPIVMKRLPFPSIVLASRDDERSASSAPRPSHLPGARSSSMSATLATWGRRRSLAFGRQGWSGLVRPVHRLAGLK